MSSTSHLTNMLSNTKSIEEELRLYDIYILIKEICQEVLPQIVREEIQKVREEIKINVIPEINGRQINLKGLENDVVQIVREAIKG